MKQITLLVLGIVLLSTGLVSAQQLPQTSQMIAQPLSVGNKHCPVTGAQVGKMGAPITYVYNGKVYNLCCPGCKSTFGNDPEKYSKIAEDDVKIAQ